MLSKNPPLWTSRQTQAVKSLKVEVQKLPPLKIPSTCMCVLQTDASDKYWGAILFEEMDGNRQICGYKSGRFKDSEQYYHSTFKEILAVKKAIERFEFHLIGHKFRIEMDMSSFPNMLQFKQKMVPHQQLLRWSEWFSKYDFESVYLKGTKNTLADMLSRKTMKQETLQEIHMMASSSSSESKRSYYDFEADVPEDAHQLIARDKFHELLHMKIFLYQSIILSNYGINCHHIAPMGIHQDYHFAHLYRIENSYMPEEVLCFLLHPMALPLRQQRSRWKRLFFNISEMVCTIDGLEWKTVESCKGEKSAFQEAEKGGLNPFFNSHTIYFFHRPVKVNRKTNKVHALPTLIHHGDFSRGVRPDFNLRDNEAYEGFQTHAFHLNNSRQTFPIPFIPNWVHYPVSYQMQLDEDLQYYMMKFNQENKQVAKATTQEKSQDYPASYFQDSQLPDEEMTIEEVEEIEEKFKFCTTDLPNKEARLEEAEIRKAREAYECPDDHYGCCDEHMLEFEMDH